MAQNIDVTNAEQLVPGETVRFDFEILPKANQAKVDLAISEIKKAVATDDRFDYQGSKVQTVGDVELQRDVQLLSIYATVRKTRREARGPIEYVQLTGFQATVVASVVVFNEVLSYVRTRVGQLAELGGEVLHDVAAGSKAVSAALPTLSVGLLLIVAVIAYTYLFGLPKRGD